MLIEQLVTIMLEVQVKLSEVSIIVVFVVIGQWVNATIRQWVTTTTIMAWLKVVVST